MELLTFQNKAEEAGLNLFGVVSVADFDAAADAKHRLANLKEDAQSAILLGTGGRSFWDSLTARERDREHPIDQATVSRIEPMLREWKKIEPTLQVVFPFEESGMKVSFRQLAEAAGFGSADSVLGILLHPEYGPWVSLRALILTSQNYPPSKRLHFIPCPPCHKPCISACPARAIQVTGFEFRSCGHHLSSSDTCVSGCLSRRACIIGPQHAYGEEEGRHRQQFATEALLRYVAPQSKPGRHL